MVLQKTSLALAVTTSLALGGIAFAQQSDANRPAAPAAGGQARDPDQNKPGDQAAGPADVQRQIDQLLLQIAADPKTAADKLFILTAALHAQSELQLAREVMQKTENEQVKKMAQQMIDSLQKTHGQLQQVAQALGLQLPQTLAQAAIQEVNIVAALPADQVDKQYTAAVQADNAQDLSQYESQAAIAQDPRVRDFAKGQVPAIQQRAQGANDVARGMDMPGRGDAQPAGATIKGKGGDGR
jgi:predicted outer membrane protein